MADSLGRLIERFLREEWTATAGRPARGVQGRRQYGRYMATSISSRWIPEVLIRPVTPADTAELARFYDGLSPESRYRRLHSLGSLGERACRRLCSCDHDRAEGFVATVAEPGSPRGRIVGHLCVDRDSPTDAEMAIAVADRYQGRGIGRALTAASLDWADRHGIRRLHARLLTDNAAIARLLGSLRRPVSYSTPDGGVVEAIVDVAPIGARAA